MTPKSKVGATRLKTGGRTRGTPNKATADIKALAGAYTDEGVKLMAAIMRSDPSGAVRVSAFHALMDRAHGKARQPLTGGDATDTPLVPGAVTIPPEMLAAIVKRRNDEV